VKDLKREARKIKEREKVSARDLMRIVGKMVWMASIWKLMKKEMTMIQWEAKKRLKKGWDVKEIVTEELRKVLERVVRTRIVKEDRERRIKREKVTAVITTDAGPRGGVAKLEVNQRVWELVMKWKKEERKESTNWREMKVLERAMERWKELMKGRTVRWITDSEVGASYIRKEIGKEKKLAKIAWRVRRIEVQYKIGGETKVVKGEEIEEVDKMSRIVDKEDYAIEKEVFKRIEKKFGRMEVDLFATRFSRKVDAFVSKEFDPIAIATDAMSIEWRNLGSLYGFPPVHKIQEVLEKVKEERVKMVIIVPDSKKARWLAMIEEMRVEEMKLGKAVIKEEREKIEKIYWKAIMVDGSR